MTTMPMKRATAHAMTEALARLRLASVLASIAVKREPRGRV
jgi:hypothetical protein